YAAVLPVTARGVGVAGLAYHAKAGVMPAGKPDVFNVVETEAHLRHHERVCRQFKHHLVVHDALEINNRRYREIQVVAPPAHYGVAPDYLVVVFCKEFLSLFPRADIVEALVGRRPANKTVIFVVRARLSVHERPEMLAA